MSPRTTKSEILEIDLSVAGDVLDRARPALLPEDHAYLEGMAQAFVEVMKLVRERGTTIARLRRLFALASSEKTKDILGRNPTAPPPDSPQSQPSPPGTSSAEDSPGDSAADAPNGTPTPDNERGAASSGGEPKPTRKGHGRVGVSEYLQTRTTLVEHERLCAGDCCPDCARGKLYQLKKRSWRVRIFGQAPLAAEAWGCSELRCGGCGKVFTARAPKEAQGPKYTESAVSMLALLRYDSGMPLNRLARLQGNLGIPLPASTQWEVVRDHAPTLEPVYAELCRCAARGRVLHNDDTSIRILAFMGKRRDALLARGALPDPDRTGLFTTAVVAVTDPGLIALFFTGRKHAGENLAALLEERDAALEPPIQMCDGLERNAPTGHVVVESNCVAHGRRHIIDEVENFPAECRHVLEALGKVFEHDTTCKKLGLHGTARLEYHQQNSGPLMAELEIWLKAQLDEKRIEPNSGLGQGFRYLLKRWQKLTLFLRVPDAPLENNICERALKMAIRHRNNSLFYRSERGAKVGDIFMSLIYTAELHDKNPFQYLTALLEHAAFVAADPASWLPWTYEAALARARASPDQAAA